MQRIAVCDDELPAQDMLREMIMHLPFSVVCTCFSTGDELVQVCRSGQQFDFVFLDIQMNDRPLGLHTAAEIRAILPEAVLIFVSGYPEYITKALSVKPDQFLLKPVRENELLDVVLTAMREKREAASEHKLYFQCRDRKIALYPRQIYYLESRGHSMIVYPVDQEAFAISSTMEKQEKLLRPYAFVKIHRCCLINLRYVYQIQGNELILEHDLHQKFTISRRYRPIFTEQYKTYMYQNMKGEP